MVNFTLNPSQGATKHHMIPTAPPADFLREYDLLDHFKLNIETNHAILAVIPSSTNCK